MVIGHRPVSKAAGPAEGQSIRRVRTYHLTAVAPRESRGQIQQDVRVSIPTCRFLRTQESRWSAAVVRARLKAPAPSGSRAWNAFVFEKRGLICNNCLSNRLFR